MAHAQAPRITVGVDTHLDVHVAHANDQLGRRVDTVQVPTTPSGYHDLLAWARGLGEPVAWGVEGTGSYGAALARFLAANGQVVVEVNRPDRAARRSRGKSDPLDAQAAARAVQAGQVTVTPKAGDGQVEMIRSLRVARATAMRARTQAINALKALLVTAPAELREQLRGLPAAALVRTAAALQPGPIASPMAAAMLALRTLAARHQALSAEISSLTTELDRLTRKAAPQLVALFGVGQDSAGALLVAAGDNPGRLRSDACFSMLCGASPIEASSGKTTRHRLNRGGDRQANAALYRIVMVRLCYDPATKDYMARRLKQGKSKKEIIRCLKRYVAREVFAVLNQMGQGSPAPAA
ncbi:MAG TPA: IS110 family transposase [Actinomycetota bacterium]|jgi:transposase|nr:IS110 family transposase [Actinomycetota bacterium]